jgi:hypothetical protein
MVGKRGILPFAEARLFAGGISDYRLHRLIEDGTLARKEDGLDADQFFVALAQQKEVRNRPREPAKPDGSAKLLLAFTPGFLEVWAAGKSAERLPGVDYDAAIRDAIVEGSGEYGAAAAIEAAIWLRFGDPAAARLEDLKQLARVIATGWPKILLWRDPPDWRDNSGRSSAVAGFYPSPRVALEAALSMRRWTIYLGRDQLIDHARSDQILAGLRFWADRAPHFNPRCDGVANELTGATIDLFDKAMAQIRRTAGQFFDFYADRCGRATC